MSRMICPECGHIGPTRTVTPGSLRIEVVLWLCLILPGLLYSLWRHARRHEGCGLCGAANLIPTESPRGRQLVAELHPAPPPSDIPPPSVRAVRSGHTIGRALGRLAVRLRR